ncbi:hypothetical protein AK812_SmicGene28146 [Symbiodinium microadriaticum]|uniref:Uncharacterized protein n=1 Tax=Symbiodinium microadriaticum TaxID=2951 RepID=A0A1Q9D5B0_SYMMI|nr:hypothetical protein AK812_SmicGene28146 [Symbiodinium microadriaticum]
MEPAAEGMASTILHLEDVDIVVVIFQDLLHQMIMTEVTQLDNWMSQCIANVLSACADPNREGHNKFNRIDVKLGVAMTAMLKNNSDHASDLKIHLFAQAIRQLWLKNET